MGSDYLIRPLLLLSVIRYPVWSWRHRDVVAREWGMDRV